MQNYLLQSAPVQNLFCSINFSISETCSTIAGDVALLCLQEKVAFSTPLLITRRCLNASHHSGTLAASVFHPYNAAMFRVQRRLVIIISLKLNKARVVECCLLQQLLAWINFETVLQKKSLGILVELKTVYCDI